MKRITMNSIPSLSRTNLVVLVFFVALIAYNINADIFVLVPGNLIVKFIVVVPTIGFALNRIERAGKGLGKMSIIAVLSGIIGIIYFFSLIQLYTAPI